MSWLKTHHDQLRKANNGKLTQAVINADWRKRGKTVTKKMLRRERMDAERGLK